MMREVKPLINTPQMHSAIMCNKDWSWPGQNMALLDKDLLENNTLQFNPQCISVECTLFVVGIDRPIARF